MRLTPEWIVGFVDGDGSFKRVETSSGFLRFTFTVSQDQRSEEVLYALKHFFKCGTVQKAGGTMRNYRVTNLQHLTKIILPFFDKYQLQTEKKQDKDRLKQQIQEYLSSRVRPLPDYKGPIFTWPDSNTLSELYKSEEWLAGLIDADGCFTVSMVNNIPRPQLILGLNTLNVHNELQESTNFELIQKISKYWHMGTFYSRKTKSENSTDQSFLIFQISALKDFLKLIQILKEGQHCRLRTKKSFVYFPFVKIIKEWKDKQPKRLLIKDEKETQYAEILKNVTLCTQCTLQPQINSWPVPFQQRYQTVIKILHLRKQMQEATRRNNIETNFSLKT